MTATRYLPGCVEQARVAGLGVITREQALSSRALQERDHVEGRAWQMEQVHRGVYATFTGPTRPGMHSSGRLCCMQGRARDSATRPQQSLFGSLTARRRSSTSPFRPIRRVRPPARRGDPHFVDPERRLAVRARCPAAYLAEETVIDLVHAATDLDDVIACVTGAFARDLTSEERLRREAAARKKLRWRADLDEIIPSRRRAARTRSSSTATTATWSRLTGSRRPQAGQVHQARRQPGPPRPLLRGVRPDHRARRQAIPPRRAPRPRPGPRQRRRRDRRIDAPLRLGRRHPQAVRLGGPSARRAHQSAATPDR